MESKNKKIKREQWDDIDVAYDRRRQRYVAYSVETNIAGTGVCIQSAVADYKSNYYKREEEHNIFEERIGAEY
jgi:hypothetical protein